MGKKGKLFIAGIATAAAATAIVAQKQKQDKAEGITPSGIDIDEKLQQVKDKVEEMQILAANATADSRNDIKVTIQNIKGDAISHAEELKRKAERSKSKLSSELLRAQMNLEVKKEEFEKELEEKKYSSEKKKEEAKAKQKAEDAALMMEFAMEIVDKATIAKLEAVDMAKAYAEKYGEEIELDDVEETVKEDEIEEAKTDDDIQQEEAGQEDE